MKSMNNAKSKKLIIVGAGEFAHLSYEFFTYDSVYEVMAFAVEKAYLKEDKFIGLPLVDLEEVENLYSPQDVEAFVAVSSQQLNRLRTRLYEKMKSKGYVMASYVSSEASVWHNVEIGDNCLVLGSSILQPFSKIGNNVILWYRSIVGHHSLVEDNCFFASAGIAGGCVVGKNTFLGGSCLVGDAVKIAEDNFIGTGTVIVKNTKPDSVYRGNPAVRVKEFSAKLFCQVEE